ncbi:MAG: nucleotide exchange factor GrpE [Acidimicrobiaceae bacterium]|nr:nucleotide exchange factor GrpE [Acidimicrobiaceae bacterium]
MSEHFHDTEFDTELNSEVAASEDAVTSDIADLALAESQRDEYLGALQRLQADFENYRKRVARSADEAGDRAVGSLIQAMLPVLDAFDLAANHFGESGSDEAAAFVQSRALLLDTLVKQGLERLDDDGVSFDPTIHDAVAHVEAQDGSAAVVDGVLRAGYRWRGAVLRPAMVRVRG